MRAKIMQNGVLDIFKKIDSARLCIIVLSLGIIFQAMPVHFFADNAEYLYLGRFYNQKPWMIFSPFRPVELPSIHHLFLYRPLDRLYWALGYRLGGLNPLPYNFIQAVLFLILTVSLYNLTRLLSGSKGAGFLTVLLFLTVPANYKLIHWLSNPVLISLSIVLLSFSLLASGLKYNNRRHFYAGLFVIGAAFLTQASVLWVIPVLYMAIGYVYKSKFLVSRGLFNQGLGCILVMMFVIGICAYIANMQIKSISPRLAALNDLSFKHILPNFRSYFKIFKGTFLVYPLLASLLILIFRPAKVLLVGCIWFIAYSIPFLSVHCVSSRYITGSYVGLCMLIGSSVPCVFSIKGSILRFFIIGVFSISILCGLAILKINYRDIKSTFALARDSYKDQSREFMNLQALPQGATVYTKNSSVNGFYYWILKVAERNDVKLIVGFPKDKIDRTLIFEGETVYDKKKNIIDKRGNWRF